MIRAAGALLFLAVASCGTPPDPTYRDLDRLGRDYEREGASPLGSATAVTHGDTCNAYVYRPRIGTPVAAWEPPEGSRVIRPGEAVTEDRRPERLNIRVDAEGRVTALECF